MYRAKLSPSLVFYNRSLSALNYNILLYIVVIGVKDILYGLLKNFEKNQFIPDFVTFMLYNERKSKRRIKRRI